MYISKAIPRRDDPEVYEPADLSGSGFVKLEDDDRFEIRMQYPVLKMKNAEPECLVRKEVAKRLKDAADLLPKGYKFRIWDAWRPFALQKELYEVYSEDLIKIFSLDRLSPKERNAVIRKYVSDPVRDIYIPPVHTTGGAVDLTVTDENGTELDMGTGFDSFAPKTHTDFYEDKGLQADGSAIRDNRRLLYNIMTEAGFTNLPSEWWHFDYGDRFWAYYNDRPALYEGVFDREVLNGYGKQ